MRTHPECQMTDTTNHPVVFPAIAHAPFASDYVRFTIIISNASLINNMKG
jgi:hypothetical protein